MCREKTQLIRAPLLGQQSPLQACRDSPLSQTLHPSLSHSSASSVTWQASQVTAPSPSFQEGWREGCGLDREGLCPRPSQARSRAEGGPRTPREALPTPSSPSETTKCQGCAQVALTCSTRTDHWMPLWFASKHQPQIAALPPPPCPAVEGLPPFTALDSLWMHIYTISGPHWGPPSWGSQVWNPGSATSQSPRAGALTSVLTSHPTHAHSWSPTSRCRNPSQHLQLTGL
jgi:hypothetical protein